MRHPNYGACYYQNKGSLPEHLLRTIDAVLKRFYVNSVLEVGCGVGVLVNFLKSKGYKAYGCDISFYAAKNAKQANADAVNLPFRDESVDSLIAISLIEHLSSEDGRSFLEEAKRVIKNKGIIFLVTPNKRSLKSIILGARRMHRADPSHIFFYSPYSLSLELRRVKFNNIQWTFPFPKDCLLAGWSIPKMIQKTNMTWVKNLVNWALISSPLSLIRDSFWILGQKSG